MSSGDVCSITKYLLIRIICLLRGCFARHSRRERDSSPDFLVGEIINDMSKGFRVLVPARFRERNRLWIDSNALSSPFLVFLPERFDGVLRNAKDGLDRRDEINGFVVLAFFVIVLILVVVGTIDDLFQTPPF